MTTSAAMPSRPSARLSNAQASHGRSRTSWRTRFAASRNSNSPAGRDRNSHARPDRDSRNLYERLRFLLDEQGRHQARTGFTSFEEASMKRAMLLSFAMLLVS